MSEALISGKVFGQPIQKTAKELTMQKPMCGTCPFFKPSDDLQWGTCRVNPPTTCDASRDGHWPGVAICDFCAEHPQASRTRSLEMQALIADRLGQAPSRSD